MAHTEALLAPSHFCRCNNCYLVNLRHVSGIQDNAVLVGTDRLLISRNRKSAFVNALTDFLGGSQP